VCLYRPLISYGNDAHVVTGDVPRTCWRSTHVANDGMSGSKLTSGMRSVFIWRSCGVTRFRIIQMTEVYEPHIGTPPHDVLWWSEIIFFLLLFFWIKHEILIVLFNFLFASFISHNDRYVPLVEREYVYRVSQKEVAPLNFLRYSHLWWTCVIENYFSYCPNIFLHLHQCWSIYLNICVNCITFSSKTLHVLTV